MFLKTWKKTAGINRSNYSKEENTVKNLRKITIKTSSHATTSLTTPYKYRKRKANTMNTIQDKSKASMGKVQDIDGDTKSIHENPIESECSCKNECICESVAKPTPIESRAERVLDKTTNLLEKAYGDWLTNAEKLDRLRTLIQKAHIKDYKLQILIQEAHRVRYEAMKWDHDSALKKVQTKYIAYELTRNKVRRTGNNLVARDSVVVISSDSEDDDSDWDTVSGSESGSKSSKDSANGDGGKNEEPGSLKMNTTGAVNSNITV